jgi:hypothetical protein
MPLKISCIRTFIPPWGSKSPNTFHPKMYEVKTGQAALKKTNVPFVKYRSEVEMPEPVLKHHFIFRNLQTPRNAPLPPQNAVKNLYPQGNISPFYSCPPQNLLWIEWYPNK